MKIYIIELLNNKMQWEIYQRVAYKNKKEAEKIIKTAKYKHYIITELKLK